MAWKDLSIAQRSQLMNIMRHNGISSLSEMRRLYDLSSPSLSSLEENTFNTQPQAPVYRKGGKKKGILDKKKIVNRVYGDAFGNGENPVGSAIKQYFTNPDGAPMDRISKLQAIRDKYDLDNKSIEDAWNIWESIPDGQDKIDFYSAMYLDTVKQHEDAKRIYYGEKPIYGTMEPARYQPTIGKGNNAYQVNNLLTDEEFDNFVLPTWADWRGTYDSARTDQRKGNVGQVFDAPYLHDSAISEGFDSRGQYISLYDLWDYNTKYAGKSGDKIISTLTGGKPFDVYNRYYLDEWLDIPEGERGNPYIAPSYVEAERSFKSGGVKEGLRRIKEEANAIAGSVEEYIKKRGYMEEGGNLFRVGGPKKQNWFTRMMMNSVLNDPKDGAVAVSAGWTRDKNGNVIQTEEAANSEGAKKLRENLAEIASMPLTDLGVEVAGAAIAGTKAYKSYKLAKELNKALKSGEFNAALKTTEEASTPIVKAAATNTKAANAATKSISGKDVEVQALRKRFNKWAEYYGYDTIPESMSVEDAEKAMKKTFDRHNTFFRGVHMPDRPADIAHLEEVFGPGYTEQQVFPYIATHARPEEAGVFVSPASNAGIYGGSGKTAVVRRGYSLGENPQTWLKDADFEIGFGGSNEAVEAAGRNNTLLFPWNEGAPVGGAVENELLAPNGVLNFVEYVPEGATPAYYDATGSLNKYLGKRWVMHGGRQSFLDEIVPKPEFKEGGKIHIKPENRGKFTALKKRTGHSASWFKAHGTPAQKKMAIFALNAKKWKHAHGGIKF